MPEADYFADRARAERDGPLDRSADSRDVSIEPSFPSSIASKAARIQIAAQGRSSSTSRSAATTDRRPASSRRAPHTSEEPTRRSNGWPARTCTASLSSGHDGALYVMTFDSEIEAFRTFARDFPTRAGAADRYVRRRGRGHAERRQVAEELRSEGVKLAGVRIDSGDFSTLTPVVRKSTWTRPVRRRAHHPVGRSGRVPHRRACCGGRPGGHVRRGTQLGTSADAPRARWRRTSWWPTSTVRRSRRRPGRSRCPVSSRCIGTRRTSTSKTSLRSGTRTHRTAGHCSNSSWPGESARSPRGSLTEMRSRCKEGLARLPDAASVDRESPAPPIRSPCRTLWAFAAAEEAVGRKRAECGIRKASPYTSHTPRGRGRYRGVSDHSHADEFSGLFLDRVFWSSSCASTRGLPGSARPETEVRPALKRARNLVADADALASEADTRRRSEGRGPASAKASSPFGHARPWATLER